jgi:peptide/nickel transport system substrate-binding protein
MFHRRAIGSIAVIAALGLAACGGDDNSTGTSSSEVDNGDTTARGGTLTLGAVVPPTTLDAAGVQWGNRAPFFQAVYDTLLLPTPDGEIEPFLATDWEYNDDNTVLTLTLRDDVEFTDGSAFDADAVVANFERFQDGSSAVANYFDDVDDFVAVDDTTVEIQLAAPNPALISYLSREGGVMASVESFDDPNIDTNPVGSGPYVLDSSATVTGTSYVYTRNDDYWNPDVQHYDEVVISVFDDPTAALNAIRAGEANGVKLANNDNLDEVEASGWTVHSNELDFQGMLLLDRDGTMNEALADVRVRQAINYAFDREGLLEALHQGHGTVTTQVFPDRSEAFDPELDAYYTYDPDKARELLAEAGYADGLTLELPISTVVGSTTFTLVGQQLEDVGITANFSDSSDYIADLLAPNYPAAWMALEQNPDWQLIHFMIAPTAVFNPFGVEDPQVNEYMESIQWGDEEEQVAVASELNAYLVEQAWFAPFYRAQGSYATDENTTVEMLINNAYPAIYDFKPAG